MFESSQGKNFQDDVVRLNNEISSLKSQLQSKLLESNRYKESLKEAHRGYSSASSSRELNPILNKIKNKNLTSKERRDIIFPRLYPSRSEDIFYQWVAPASLNVTRDRQWFWTMGLLLAVIIMISLIFSEIIWIAVALSFFFAIYVQASTPTYNTIYRLTKQGIEIGEGSGVEIFGWGQLLEYAYYYKYNTEFVYIYTILPSQSRFLMLFSPEDRKNINIVLESNIPYMPPPKKQGIIEKWLNGIYITLNDFKKIQEKIDDFYNEKYSQIIQSYNIRKKDLQSINNEELKKTMHNDKIRETNEIINKINSSKLDEAKKILKI